MPVFEYVGSNLVEAFLIVLVHAHCEVSREKACTMNLEYSREEISGIPGDKRNVVILCHSL